MEFDSILGTIARHRVVAIVGVVLAIVAGVTAAAATHVSYKTQGSVLLVPPALSAEQANETGRFGEQNPLLGFDNTLVINSRLVVQALQGSEFEQKLRDAGATSKYALQTSVDQVTPLVVVKASGTDSASVKKTAEIVMDEIGSYLADFQKELGAPDGTLITTRKLTTPDSVSESWSSRLVRGIGAAVIVLVLTALLIALLDWLERRRDSSLGASRDTTPAFPPSEGSGGSPDQPAVPGAASVGGAT